MSVKSITFRVGIVIEPDDDQYHAYCPALEGLHVSGTTEAEALQHARDAVMAYLRSLIKHGDPIPLGIISEVETYEGSKPHPSRHIHQHIEELALATT